MPKGVSIVIVNYNGLDQLKRCLPSIVAGSQGTAPCEIMVVDNGSSDGSQAFIKTSCPKVKLVALDKNYGFGQGINKGADQAEHELILFLNNDIEATNNFLAPLVKHFADPEVFGVSPKVIRPTQNMLNESIIVGEFKGGIIAAEFAIGQKLIVPDNVFEVFSICGAAFMVDKAKFFELGKLDEMLRPIYYEETDLAYRALKRGWKMLYEPKSVVFHQHSQTISKNFSKSAGLASYRKNQYLCVWKNITDPWLLTKHLFQMVLVKALIPNFIEWQALFGAVRQIPEVIKQKRQQKPLTRFSDRQVFARAAEQIKAITAGSKPR